MKTSRKWFGTDGIRDVAGMGLLTPAMVSACGRALGRMLAEKGRARVLAGRDTRESGPLLLDQLAEGLLDHGHTLHDAGVLTTPAVQLLAREEHFDLAIVVSASHNPAEDNGLKFFSADGRKLADEREHEVERLMELELASASRGTGGGERVNDPGAARRYLHHIRHTLFPDLDLSRRTIVLDCAHGAAHTIGPELLRLFGARVITRGTAPDGRNINAGAGVFAVGDLAGPVRSHQALLGLALDGDADRVLLMDETGTVRDGDHMLGLLAADLLARGQLTNNVLVSTVMANFGLMQRCRQLGIHCELTPVGDRHVAAAMDRLDAAVGGEQSGHIIFRQGERRFGDGLYTALRILEVLERTSLPLSTLSDSVRKFPQLLLNVRVSRRAPLEELAELMAAQQRVEQALRGDGRVVLRYSGTELLLRVMVEGADEALVDRGAREIADAARRVLGDA